MTNKHVAQFSTTHDTQVAVQLLGQISRQFRFDADMLIDRAGLAHRLPFGFETDAMLTRTELARLFEALVLSAEERACRLGVISQALPNGGFTMMCFALIGCATLGQAIAMATRFFDVFTRGNVCLSLSERDGRAWFSMATPSERAISEDSFLLAVAGLRSFAQLFSWLIGENLDVDQACVRYPWHPSVIDLSALLGVGIQTAQPSNGFGFAADRLQRPVVRSHQDLVELVQFFPFDLLPPVYDNWLLAEQILKYFRASLQYGAVPTLVDTARAFNLSLSTLRRRLAEEGRPFQTIKDEVRAQLAAELLERTPQTLAQIGAALGFHDVANFRRSFRGWYGQSPSAFRSARRETGRLRTATPAL